MKFLKLLGNIFFIFSTIILTITFSIALKEKIDKPNFKNLDSQGFIIFGIILSALIFFSFKILLAYFKKHKI